MITDQELYDKIEPTKLEYISDQFLWVIDKSETELKITATHIEECLIYEIIVKDPLQDDLCKDAQPIKIDPEDLYILFQELFTNTLDEKIKITLPTTLKDHTSNICIVIQCSTKIGKPKINTKFVYLAPKPMDKEEILTKKLFNIKHFLLDKITGLQEQVKTLESRCATLEAASVILP
jgi:hypothetical protein